MSSNKLENKGHPNLRQYHIEEVLGHGSYGKVKLASHKLTNEKVAIKFVEKSKLVRINDSERIQKEMKIISELNHPNILREIEIFEDDKYFYIVTERPSKGDLFKFICSKKRLTMTEASFMFYQIVNAVDYIHKNGIVHRDLKPENILLSQDMIIKLADFGLSNYYTNGIKLKTTCGSPAYSAPEMLKGKKYDPIPVDIWGLGIILYVMICGELPFEANREDELFIKISHCDINFPYFCNASCKALIKRILLLNPKDRISIEEIKASNFYITGRANFLKEFKIYNDDGNILPQVYSYIRDKTLNSLEVCSIKVNNDSERSSAFLIFFLKYLHKTDWNNYHIPMNSLIDRAFSPSPERVKGKDFKANQKSNKKQALNTTLLLIPKHSTVSDRISMVYPNTTNIKTTSNKCSQPKLPLLTHSFDSDLKIKPITVMTTNPQKTGQLISFRSISAKNFNCKKNHFEGMPLSSRKHLNNNSTIQTYSIDEYEKDLKYLHKKGYRYGSFKRCRESSLP